MARDKNQGVQLRNARPYNWLDAQDKKDSSNKRISKTKKKSAAKNQI